MATVLRELIARVVFRVDDSTLKRLDTQIDAVKSHIAQTQAQAQQGLKVNVAVNATEAEKSLTGIRVALAGIGTAVDPAALANLQEQFGTASGAADKLRLDIDRLKAADPSNPRIAELTRQLNAVESEAKQTATALDKAKSSIDGVKSSCGLASGMLGQFRNALGGLGIALGAAGLSGFVHQTLEAAGAVEDLSDRLGMGIEEVQVWSAFAKQAGADSEALTASPKGLANAMQGAANGGKEQKAAFEALRISTDNGKKGLPPLTDTLALVGVKLGEVDNEGQRLALTQKLLSEGGLKLAPAFKGGTAAVQEQLENLKELSVVYSEDFVKSSGAAGDELDLFYGQFRGLGCGWRRAPVVVRWTQWTVLAVRADACQNRSPGSPVHQGVPQVRSDCSDRRRLLRDAQWRQERAWRSARQVRAWAHHLGDIPHGIHAAQGHRAFSVGRALWRQGRHRQGRLIARPVFWVDYEVRWQRQVHVHGPVLSGDPGSHCRWLEFARRINS